MDVYLNTLRTVAEDIGYLDHRARGDDLRERLAISFEATEEYIFSELRHLERLRTIALAAIVCSLLLLAICITSGIVFQSWVLGISGTVLSLCVKAVSLLVFRRVDRSREQLDKHLPRYAAHHSMQFCLKTLEKAALARREVSASWLLTQLEPFAKSHDAPP
jgi:hypothetical protein